MCVFLGIITVGLLFFKEVWGVVGMNESRRMVIFVHTVNNEFTMCPKFLYNLAKASYLKDSADVSNYYFIPKKSL